MSLLSTSDALFAIVFSHRGDCSQMFRGNLSRLILALQLCNRNDTITEVENRGICNSFCEKEAEFGIKVSISFLNRCRYIEADF